MENNKMKRSEMEGGLVADSWLRYLSELELWQRIWLQQAGPLQPEKQQHKVKGHRVQPRN